MLDTITDLSSLHALHLKLQEVNEELASGPRQIAARKKRIANAEQVVADREDELRKARNLADQKSLDLKTREAKVAELTGKLNNASSNKEYEAIKSQIAADVAASSVLEDESLEAMDRVDSTIQELDADKATVAKYKAELDEYAAKFAERKVVLESEAATLGEKIRLSEGLIPAGEAREAYRRMVDSAGADAMSRLEDGVCSGCYTQVPMQNRVMLNSGETVFCGSCKRLLYKEPEAPVR